MADISQYLQDILDAVYGEQVRGSIHDAIEIINDVSEVVLTLGTAVDSASSSSTGFFTNSLYLNTNSYVLWKCVGTDSWASQGVLKGSPGVDGNKWYRATGIAGKAANPTVYSGSGIAMANPNDFYLNPVEGAVYYCVTGGNATTATWSYDFTMTGGGGSSYTAGNGIDPTDLALGTITLDYGTVSGSNTTKPVTGKSVDDAIPDMVANGTYESSLVTKASDPTDDDYVSGYAVANWSNVDAIQILTAVSADDDGVGTWEDDDTWETSGVRTGWITHSALYGVLSHDDVEIEPVFKITSGASDAVSLYAMRIDDAVTGSTGGVALKFNAPITASGYVGIRLKHLRTNTEIV